MNLRQLFPLSLFSLLLVVSPAQGDVFDIIVNFSGTASPSQMQAFADAEATLEGIITGTDVAGFGTININASIAADDGPGGTLGFAQITNTGVGGGFRFSEAGIMSFDSADVPDLEADGTFAAVVLHEMIHLVGFGSLWEGTNNLLTTPSNGGPNVGEYTGAAALAAYNAEFGLNASFIPVENDGGPGTFDGHWDEQFFGDPTGSGAFSAELMTGFLDAGSFLSATTRASFIDLGYNVVPEPGLAGMLISGLVLAAIRRRRG